jgi:hypothetical protein
MTEHPFLSYLVLFISKAVLAPLLSQFAAQPRHRRLGRYRTAASCPAWRLPCPIRADLAGVVRPGA